MDFILSTEAFTPMDHPLVELFKDQLIIAGEEAVSPWVYVAEYNTIALIDTEWDLNPKETEHIKVRVEWSIDGDRCIGTESSSMAYVKTSYVRVVIENINSRDIKFSAKLARRN